MKKLSVFLMFVVLLFAACSNSSGDTDSDQDLDKDDQVVTDNQDDDEKEDADEKADVETDQSEDSDATDDEENTENKQEDQDQSAEEQLKELSLQIFAAQRDEDYDFLEGILSEGSTLNKDSKTFSFDDVAYPHEQEFVQDDEGNIEYRYIHEEDADTIIVGFAVTDYEAESSVTIDFQFVLENGEWKMNDMDMNA